MLAETQKLVEKTKIEFNEKLHEKYPESFREEKLLIEKRNGKIKKQPETKRVRKWINFKSNKHIGRANTTKKSTHLVSPKRKEGNVTSKDIVFLNKEGRVAWWLATCARKPKVPGSSPAASYVQR